MKNLIHVNRGEKILWKGRPDKKVSVFEGVFNPMLPFALIWGAIDGFAISDFFKSETLSSMGVFFLIHLFPVWLYLFGAITAGIKASHTAYVVTDRAIYFQKGIFTVTTERAPLNEVTHTGIHVGIIDHIFGTGDVVTVCIHDIHRIENIRSYEKLSSLISRVSEDQYTDTMYPNDRRPEENHGYRTRYSGNTEDY